MSVVDLFNQIARNDFGFFQQLQTVADVMTAAPPTLSLDDNLQTATELFRRASIDHAPVINPEDSSIVGIISDRDIARHHPRLLGKAAEQDEDHKALQLSVTRFMTRGPVVCRPDASPIDAMSLMLDHHVDSIVVSKDGKQLDGLVTIDSFIQSRMLYHRVCTRDVQLRRLRLVDLDLKNGIPLDKIFSMGAQTVRDVMTKDVRTLCHDDHLSTAIEQMQEYEIRHLPVVHTDGKTVGVLSDKDILRYLPVHQQSTEDPETRFRQKLFATDDKESLHQRVDSVMSSEMHPIQPGMLLTDALDVFMKHGVCGLPVIEPGNVRLCGIVTKSDIIRVFRVVMQIGKWSETPVTVDIAEGEAVTA